MRLAKLLLLVSFLGAAACSFGEVTGVFVDSDHVTGAALNPRVGTVVIQDEAGVGGENVFLSDDSAGAFYYNTTTVHIPEGETTGNFTVGASGLYSTATPHTIFATDGSQPTPASTVLTINPMRVTGFQIASGAPCARGTTIQVTLKLNAPTAVNLGVNLIASDPGFTFPGGNTIVVPMGQKTVTVPMQISDTANNATVTCEVAATGVWMQSSNFKVVPLNIVDLDISGAIIVGGESTDCLITMNGVVTNNTTITLAAGSFLTVPTTVTVLAGTNQVTFTIGSKSTGRDRSQGIKATAPSGSRRTGTIIVTAN